MRINWYRLSVLIIVSLAIVSLASCTSQKPVTESPPPTSGQVVTPAWMKIELTDIATGETFRIGDFKGRPILLESFAVWCPTCLAQQEQIKAVIQIEGEKIVHIALDTDPNEDEDQVREHLERNELDWYFAISPAELSQALIDEFGLSFVSAPRAPVALICEDQSTRFLRSGIKSAEELISEIERGCQ